MFDLVVAEDPAEGISALGGLVEGSAFKATKGDESGESNEELECFMADRRGAGAG